MKEHIYTIPVTEAFEQGCECPLCFCQKRLELEALEYELGAAMMEPDHRVLTNQNGFCTRHYEKLYNLQKNRLPFGLVLDTHMAEQAGKIAALYRGAGDDILEESGRTLLAGVKDKFSRKKSATDRFSQELLTQLDKVLTQCVVCERVQRTVKQYADTIIYLFFREPDFREHFDTSKGFCLPHFKLLLEIGEETLPVQKKAMFIRSLLPLELEHLERVGEDVHWFTQMFDHKNREADWKDSKDALSRAVEKLGGKMDLV